MLSLLLLAGCGFKLRGNFDMPPFLDQVSIEGGERDLTDLLETRLTDSGSTVVPPGSDQPTIIITRSELERKVRTRDANGLATGYTFLYTVDFTVTDGVGGVLSKPASISQVKTLEFDPEQVLQAEREEEFLVEEMEQDIVLQLMRRLVRL
jgi:LPS-assembly lipoprotein